jgi:adenine-specific DNA-methyltransferase
MITENPPKDENPRYLTEQLVTYIGNKRALLGFIEGGVETAKRRLGKKKISSFDVFSGSGIVARFLKRHSSLLVVNDLERYSEVINRCYLANRDELDLAHLERVWRELTDRLASPSGRGILGDGLIAKYYAPADDTDIKPGERVFYTTRNARYLDAARTLIEELPQSERNFFLAPLISEASIHANTSGVFKGFYKNSDTGIGKFGGRQGDALSRILGDISLPFPVFSDHSCESLILTGDANKICDTAPEVDVAYLDPPYNQHPYGSNYFMLNLLADYREPMAMSQVSGIPADWNRSAFNRKRDAGAALAELAEKIRAKFLIVSFNSEGFIGREEMESILSRIGKTETLETKYNAFRGSRNLSGRDIHVKEYLYLVEKR